MNKKDEVRQIAISMLKPFPNHPFYVREDEMMNQLVESIRQVGILVPVITRPTEDGFYELISGHRRTHACRLLGYEAVPAIIKEMEITEATIMVVDSNFQREVILPSEKAKAYKMKLDAIKC